MSDVTITMEDDNLSVVDKPMMSTQAIVFIALASASAAFTLGAGIWCLFYGAFGRGLRQRRCREAANRQSQVSSVTVLPATIPVLDTQTQTQTKTQRRSSFFRLPWLTIDTRSNSKKTTPDMGPASPAPSSISSLNLQKLYPISPAMLSIQQESPSAQAMMRSDSQQFGSTASISAKSLDLGRLWPISPAMVSHQAQQNQPPMRSVMSEHDVNRVTNSGFIHPTKPKAQKGFW